MEDSGELWDKLTSEYNVKVLLGKVYSMLVFFQRETRLPSTSPHVTAQLSAEDLKCGYWDKATVFEQC